MSTSNSLDGSSISPTSSLRVKSLSPSQSSAALPTSNEFVGSVGYYATIVGATAILPMLLGFIYKYYLKRFVKSEHERRQAEYEAELVLMNIAMETDI